MICQKLFLKSKQNQNNMQKKQENKIRMKIFFILYQLS